MSDTTTTPTPTPAAAPAAAAPSQPTLPLPTPGAERLVDVDPRDVIKLRDEAEKAKAAAAAAKAEAAAAVAAARAEADERIKEVTALAELRAAGVVRPEHAYKLIGPSLTMIGGKLVSRDDATKPGTDVIKAFLDGEGAYMLGPRVPSGGAGAPAAPTGPASAPPLDLSTSEGMTAYARGLLSGSVARLRGQGS